MPKSPDILLICTDQQAATALSCTGNEYLHTPVSESTSNKLEYQ